MSRIFGEIRQIAFVVRDIDQAMEYWARTLGVGPFYIKRGLQFSDYRYQGRLQPSPSVSIALSQSGPVQIELIQQHDEHPSVYKDFLDRDREGLQHISSWHTRAGFDLKKAELLEQGLSLAQECTIPSSGVRLAYFATETPDGQGLIFEISDLMEPRQLARVQSIARTAEKWNGEQAVIEIHA